MPMAAATLSTLGFISPGTSELLVVALAFLLLFGAKETPAMMRKLFDFLARTRRAAEHFRDTLLYGDGLSDLDPRPPVNDPEGEEPENRNPTDGEPADKHSETPTGEDGDD